MKYFFDLIGLFPCLKIISNELNVEAIRFNRHDGLHWHGVEDFAISQNRDLFVFTRLIIIFCMMAMIFQSPYRQESALIPTKRQTLLLWRSDLIRVLRQRLIAIKRK